MRRHGGRGEAAFLKLLAVGRVQALSPEPADFDRTAEPVGQYANLDLGAASASIVALAERLGISRIATVDRRDFAGVRPSTYPPSNYSRTSRRSSAAWCRSWCAARRGGDGADSARWHT